MVPLRLLTIFRSILNHTTVKVNYLKGLDTLRAIASLIVVWCHIEVIKRSLSIPNLYDKKAIFFPSGHYSVVLFFVLSGFLITYLLVREKEKTGVISLRKFYMRRILRIWPLYYTVILLSYFLIDANYTSRAIVLCLSIFPNIATALGEGWPTSPQIWSIGVEEQFYLFWPLVLLLLPEKKVIIGLILFFIGYSIFPYLFGLINSIVFQNEHVGKIIYKFFFDTKFNCMAIGSLMGYSFARGKIWTKKLGNDVLVIILILLSFGLWFFRFKLSYFTDEIFAVLFSMMIVGIVSCERINIENKLLRFLGKVSYGIYMYHWIVILIVSKYIKYDDNDLVYNLKLYLTVIASTILISWISYNTLERFFLNIKKRYEIENNNTQHTT